MEITISFQKKEKGFVASPFSFFIKRVLKISRNQKCFQQLLFY